MFAGPTLIHNFLMYELEGIAYYGSDALFYLLILFALNKLVKSTDLTFEIAKVCIVAVALDGVGLVAWLSWQPMDGYNVAFMALYAYAALQLLKRDKADDRGGYEVGGWNNYIRVVVGASNPVLQSHREAP